MMQIFNNKTLLKKYNESIQIIKFITKFYSLFFMPIFSLMAMDLHKCYSLEVLNDFINHHRNHYIKNINSIHLYSIEIEKVKIDVYIPELKNNACYKNLLVLPGWKFSRNKWFEETKLLEFINNFNYIAIAPEMNISIYESQYFQETKFKWHKKPGMLFIEEDLIPYFHKYNLFQNQKYNMGLGLSTGARGIVLIASRNPNLLFSIGALSGDYDQTITPKDNLIRLMYGEFSQYPERWNTIDNPIFNIKKNGWHSNIYIGHGLKDNIVSYKHSEHFYHFLKNGNSEKLIEYHLCNDCKHDFYYWNKELNPIFTFFEKTILKD
jgi:hypothetical protein